jgi:putative heme-binding domain-containing protein
LRPLAADPDAGVRRELILALRNLPTDRVGEALKTLARTWDGQDRWYLEALGLALDTRDKAYLESLFDGTLYGDLGGDEGQAVALPPYFPVDRNEAYLLSGAKELPASALSKSLGLAWRIHQPAVLPLLARVASRLTTPELQQAADDVVRQIADPAGAEALAALAADSNDPTRKRQVLELLGLKLEGNWAPARSNPRVLQVIQAALVDPATRPSAMLAAAATGDARFAEEITAQARNAKASDEVRVAAVEALGRLKPPKVRAFFEELIAGTQGKGHSNSLAEAAVRSLPKLGDANRRLADLIVAENYPLGLRREALRTFARTSDGGHKVLALARDGKLPADLRTEATTVAHAHPDSRVRNEAAKVLPLPKSRSGRPLPAIGELLQREGRADRGRTVFFQANTTQAGQVSCGGCHRVQGRGEWVGPDLSTIGTKYGKDELLRSILNPSAAIGYNYKTAIVATKDGQVFTGLPVEDGPDRLVLKTAEAKRVSIRPGEVDDRSTSDVSLMPEGLAETMGDQDLVDLLAVLSALRQPVSIVGQYQAIGPLADTSAAPAFDPTAKVNLRASLTGPGGRALSWRRLDANAEGRADLSTLAGDDPKQAVYLYAPVGSPIEQEARLVLETSAQLKAWLNGKELALPDAQGNEPRSVSVRLPKGPSDLLIRAVGGASPALVTTFVADRPVAFGAEESKADSH